MRRVFERDELINIAKRENNTKRSYLYVNPLQGKHVPVSPSISIELFSALADKVSSFYNSEKLLVIGFAETATAIGSVISVTAPNVKYYLNTTRENIPGAEYLFFTEAHSHATEQRLVINGLDLIILEVDRIVFAEDEVTTGNTIVKLINVIKQKYPEADLKFGIASLLNSMDKERIAELKRLDVECLFLHQIPVEYCVNTLERVSFKELRLDDYGIGAIDISYPEVVVRNYWNSRIVSSVQQIIEKSQCFIETVLQELHMNFCESEVLILGTEEFMYPAMLLGSEIEKRYNASNVRFHATTRSPIEISEDVGYPLFDRYSVSSIYEQGRRTFIYNLKKYDSVIVVTDARHINQRGYKDLLFALQECGNTNIFLVKWEE